VPAVVMAAQELEGAAMENHAGAKSLSPAVYSARLTANRSPARKLKSGQPTRAAFVPNYRAKPSSLMAMVVISPQSAARRHVCTIA
jgi:hypothetical protein